MAERSSPATIGALGRAAITALVRERLAAVPGMVKVPAHGLDLFLLEAFLDEADCRALITRIEADRHPSKVLMDLDDPDFRTSESCNLHPHAPLTRAIEAKIGALTGIDPRHGETIQGQRYAAGQRFKLHHDYFHTDQPYWPEQERMGGQRTWTAMVYLNQPDEGGETAFPGAGVRIAARPGNLLAWSNLDAAGDPNPHALHEGTPVVAGVKYIITKWYRERPWAVPQ